jgi:ionotropic glutamate receptor
MKTIEKTWFKEAICLDSNTKISSNNNLGLESFWGLFLIAGVSSLLALLIFVITFICQNKHILLNNDPNTSVWQRVCILIRIFDQRDSNCHTFKKSVNEIKSTNSRHQHNDDDLGGFETSLGTHCPPSPSSQTKSNISVYSDFSPDIEMDVVQITNQEVSFV